MGHPSLLLMTTCLILLLSNFGCNDESPTAPVPELTKPSAQESEAFLIAFEKAIGRKDPASIQRMVDWTTLMETATAGLQASVDTRKQFLAQVQKTFEQGQGFGGELVEALQQGGSYQIVDVGTDYATATYRLLMSDDEKSDYHELQLSTRDEKTRLTDIFVYSSGEPLSRSLRRNFLLHLKRVQPEIVAKLSGWESDFLNSENRIAELYESSRNRDWLAVRDTYNKLPATLQSDAQLWLQAARATSRIQHLQQLVSEIQAGELQQAEHLYDQLPPRINGKKEMLVEYLQKVNQQKLNFPALVSSYRQQHPKPACVDFLTRGGYLEMHDFAGALQCVKELQTEFPKDAYPLVMQAQFLNVQKKTGAARQAALAALQKDPTLEAAHWALVKSSLIDKTWTETVRHLTVLQQQFHQPLTNIHLLPEFEDFIQSAEFRKWQTPALRVNSN